MTAPVAIRAVYADYRRVKGRKVHQIILEIPSELWPEAYSFLGEPSIDSSDWYAIARLEDGKVVEPTERWKPDYQHPAKACALLCQKSSFWDFLASRGRLCENEADAAEYVRHHCDVNTRADFATNPVALRKWQALESAYLAWLPEAA